MMNDIDMEYELYLTYAAARSVAEAAAWSARNAWQDYIEDER